MKRRVLIKRLLDEGCVFAREGRSHSVFFNPYTKRISTIPRHTEINDLLVKKIFKDLGIPN